MMMIIIILVICYIQVLCQGKEVFGAGELARYALGASKFTLPGPDRR